MCDEGTGFPARGGSGSSRRLGCVLPRPTVILAALWTLGIGCGNGSDGPADLDASPWRADPEPTGQTDNRDALSHADDGFRSDDQVPGDRDAFPPDQSGEIADLSCPAFAESAVVATVTAQELREVSGLAASRRHRDILWALNDSGSGPRIYALGLDGQLKGRFDLEGVEARDWEDIDRGPLEGLEGDAIFVADVGDNDRQRPFVTVHVVEEPSNLQMDPAGTLPVAVSMRLAYPGGPEDCEAIFVDPVDGSLYLVTKTGLDGGLNPVYRKAPPHARSTTPTILQEVARIPSLVATGASMSEDGSVLVVRNPFHGVLYRRGKGQPLELALAAAPCELPLFVDEPTGEAIAMDPGGTGFWSLSEFGKTSRQDLHWTALTW